MSFSPARVLVPFDFSQRAIQAIAYAQTIASPIGVIYVAHIIDDYYPCFPSHAHSETMEEKQRILHTRRMRESIQAAGLDPTTLHLCCEIGDPGSELARLAGELHAEIVIIPSHGRRGVNRWLLGSVAERVARQSPCAVLILRDIPLDAEDTE